MKVLVRKESRVVVRMFEDDAQVILRDDATQVGEPAQFFIGHCNSANAFMYESAQPPEDWLPEKYIFDGATWSINPDWIQP